MTEWTDVLEVLKEFQDQATRAEARAAEYTGSMANFYNETALRYKRYKNIVEQVFKWENEKQNAFEVACGHVRDGHPLAAADAIEAYVDRVDNP